MKQFMIIHHGFEKPSPEDMQAWNDWFAAIKDIQTSRGGFVHGRHLTKDGVADLPFGPDSFTGYNIIQAEDLDAAEKIAAKCPMVIGMRIYELREH